MENKCDNKITVNSTRLRGLMRNINKITFHQKKMNALTKCVITQCESLLDKESKKSCVIKNSP